MRPKWNSALIWFFDDSIIWTSIIYWSSDWRIPHWICDEFRHTIKYAMHNKVEETLSFKICMNIIYSITDIYIFHYRYHYHCYEYYYHFHSQLTLLCVENVFRFACQKHIQNSQQKTWRSRRASIYRLTLELIFFKAF